MIKTLSYNDVGDVEPKTPLIPSVAELLRPEAGPLDRPWVMTWFSRGLKGRSRFDQSDVVDIVRSRVIDDLSSNPSLND